MFEQSQGEIFLKESQRTGAEYAALIEHSGAGHILLCSTFPSCQNLARFGTCHDLCVGLVDDSHSLLRKLLKLTGEAGS